MAEADIVGGALIAPADIEVVFLAVGALEGDVLEISLLKNQRLAGNGVGHGLPALIFEQIGDVILSVVLKIHIEKLERVSRIARVSGRHAVGSTGEKKLRIGRIVLMRIEPAYVDV